LIKRDFKDSGFGLRVAGGWGHWAERMEHGVLGREQGFVRRTAHGPRRKVPGARSTSGINPFPQSTYQPINLISYSTKETILTIKTNPTIKTNVTKLTPSALAHAKNVPPSPFNVTI
ncbi:MAG: hypothetical protein JSW26_20330, partial [Desulfobacterales bacterium]